MLQFHGYLLAILLILAVPAMTTSCFLVEDRPTELSTANTGPYLTSHDNLDSVQALLDEGDPLYSDMFERLLEQADSLLTGELYSVTFKNAEEIRANPHDYVSMATYAWPNPDTEDGLPYVNRDGQPNEEIHNYDRRPLSRMSTAIEYLALAWYFTEEEKYAEKAADHIRSWFLEKKTKMNPHFKYAQFWPGQSEGGLQGIIEARDFIEVIEGASLIYNSNAWSADEHRDLKYWFYDFLRWMMGVYNNDAFLENNVGTWIDAQKTIYALFTEQNHLLQSAKFILPLNQRMDKQITSSGEQPRELNRATAPNYTWLNLKGYIYQAEMRTHSGSLPAQYRTSSIYRMSGQDGSLIAALDWLFPYVAGERDWRSDNLHALHDFNACRYIDLYRPAALALQDVRYETLVQNLISKNECQYVTSLLTYPPLWTRDNLPGGDPPKNLQDRVSGMTPEVRSTK